MFDYVICNKVKQSAGVGCPGFRVRPDHAKHDHGQERVNIEWDIWRKNGIGASWAWFGRGAKLSSPMQVEN